jgi:hypothetical protein
MRNQQKLLVGLLSLLVVGFFVAIFVAGCQPRVRTYTPVVTTPTVTYDQNTGQPIQTVVQPVYVDNSPSMSDWMMYHAITNGGYGYNRPSTTVVNNYHTNTPAPTVINKTVVNKNYNKKSILYISNDS